MINKAFYSNKELLECVIDNFSTSALRENDEKRFIWISFEEQHT